MTTFLDLTNNALERLNEVPLTSSTFAGATGFHSVAKTAVNNTIRAINRESHKWPFNQKTGQQVLVADQLLYDYPADAKVLDFNTFSITYTRDGEVGYGVLTHIDYDQYMRGHYVRDQYLSGTGQPRVPWYVFKHGDQFGITDLPSHADVVDFTYWGWSAELVAYGDSSDIPARYDDVILFGTLRDCYDFRSMTQQSNQYHELFMDGIKDMRSQLVNDFVEVKDTRIIY